jgi:glycosyltransferase involved in cell wall biosynthesis
MQKPLALSVCLISGAEVSRLGRALESVAPWAAEIVVVLNEEVHDGTEEVAKRFGAKVFREPWKGFIAQKNSACDKASQPWVLNLDADEVVPPALAEEIAVVVSSPQPARPAYEFPRCTCYCGTWIRHGDWYPDRCTRLWQKGKARWAGIDPHAALEVDGAVGRLRHDLFHYTAESLSHQVAKSMKYADDFARHCQESGRRIRAADLVVRPAWRFVRGYFLKLGFLDGWQGYSIAWLTAFYTFLRYVKAREAQLEAEVRSGGSAS